jgi:hypothetical protein
MTRIAATQPGTGLTNKDITGVKKWSKVAADRLGLAGRIRPVQEKLVNPDAIFRCVPLPDIFRLVGWL